MAETYKIFREQIGRRFQFLTPMAHRVQNTTRRLMRRAMRKPRTVSEGPNLLPLLIQVLAAFSKAKGEVLEEEIDSSLSFLRHDYPESEMCIRDSVTSVQIADENRVGRAFDDRVEKLMAFAQRRLDAFAFGDFAQQCCICLLYTSRCV